MGRNKLFVIDYGVNNVGSVVNMLSRLNVETATARTGPELADVGAIVLPGIGAFDTGVSNLKERGLFDAIRVAVVERSIPILGICLGMQLLSRSSEEGALGGLDLVPSRTVRIPAAPGLKVPHMGWNETECLDRELFAGLEDAPRFYFVHSYQVTCDEPSDVAARCMYGAPFVAALRRGHVFGTQFHPEKSHRFGKQVLANFVRLAGYG